MPLMINLKNYIVIDVIEVRQLQNGLVFTGKITFQQLNSIFKLTERKEDTTDPFDGSKIKYTTRTTEFQRQLSEKKLKEIQLYLREEIKQINIGKSLGLFPSSLILYNRSFESDDLVIDTKEKLKNDEVELTEQIIHDSYTSELDCCFYRHQSDDYYKLYIPNNTGITLIVDGQHRFYGTKLLYNSVDEKTQGQIDDFEFIMTFLVGFDVYEVGQIFATVNFNQKPVNRSLYYDIFGSAPQTDREGNLQNDIRLAHDLALHLNNNESSPIYSMIKLLGKGEGLFSQAFFVKRMLALFKSGIWNKYLIDYINGGNEYKDIAQFMKDYLYALFEAYPSAWPEKVNKKGKLVYSSYYYDYILCKTTGLGAFFRLIKDIYPKISKNSNSYKKEIMNYFTKISDKDADKLFSSSGIYGGAGSEGLQDKLYLYLKSKFGLN